MISKKIQCPNCKNIINITGNPGEKKIIVCPNCNRKGKYVFQITEDIADNKKKSIAISVTNLIKNYNGTNAVNNISFNVNKGEIFGFLGPNGAGKTTTIKSILGLIHTNSGDIRINEIDIKNKQKEAKKYIGYLPERVAFYDNLTAMQNLNFYAEMKKTPFEECKRLIEEFGLEDSINKKVGTFSKGMIQRLGVARALIGTPPILFLDEPSGGLDPRGKVLVRDKIIEMKKKGITIFISSHILGEIQEVCDRVGIINKGILVAEDTVTHLSTKLNIKPKITVQLEKVSKEIVNSVKNVKGVDIVDEIGRSIDVICDSKTKAQVILAIAKAGGNIINLYTREPSLEEVFMRLTEDKK